jgi:hypothetical protein
MSRKDIVINNIWKGIRLGVQLATDRENNILPDLSLLKTTVESHWWVSQCPVCNDSSRENDHVRKCLGCNQAYYDDPAFNFLCWHNHFANDDKYINCKQRALIYFNAELNESRNIATSPGSSTLAEITKDYIHKQGS